MNVIKYSRAINRVNVESNANVSETSPVSILRVSEYGNKASLRNVGI
jgi:hypothetical protein